MVLKFAVIDMTIVCCGFIFEDFEINNTHFRIQILYNIHMYNQSGA